MSKLIWIIFLVFALIVSRLVKTSMKKATADLPKKEWQNEGKSILETLFDVKNIEEEAEKTEKIKPQKAKVETKKELKPNPTYEDRNQALEEQNKERKFSLAEAVIYSSILERPYK